MCLLMLCLGYSHFFPVVREFKQGALCVMGIAIGCCISSNASTRCTVVLLRHVDAECAVGVPRVALHGSSALLSSLLVGHMTLCHTGGELARQLCMHPPCSTRDCCMYSARCWYRQRFVQTAHRTLHDSDADTGWGLRSFLDALLGTFVTIRKHIFMLGVEGAMSNTGCVWLAIERATICCLDHPLTSYPSWALCPSRLSRFHRVPARTRYQPPMPATSRLPLLYSCPQPVAN